MKPEEKHPMPAQNRYLLESLKAAIIYVGTNGQAIPRRW